MEPYEIEIDAIMIFKVRADTLEEAQARVTQLRRDVGTFMIDTGDWRFGELSPDEREAIVEIYAEEV